MSTARAHTTFLGELSALSASTSPSSGRWSLAAAQAHQSAARHEVLEQSRMELPQLPETQQQQICSLLRQRDHLSPRPAWSELPRARERRSLLSERSYAAAHQSSWYPPVDGLSPAAGDGLTSPTPMDRADSVPGLAPLGHLMNL